MTLEEILARLERDGDQHMTQLCTELELQTVEQTLGRPLPPSLRTLLSRVGAGIFYNAHEIFGARPVIIHDIELVPDLVSIERALRRDGGQPEHWLIFHRAAEAIHAFDLGRSDGATPIVRLSDPAVRYPDLSTFLSLVLLPRGSAGK